MHHTQLDKDLPVPLYHQLKTVLLERIRGGHWRPNEQLPTEDALSSQFSVSKATVRQAISDLVQMGLVRREQGRGTFVSESKIRFGPRELTSFTEEMRDSGLQVVSRILEQKVVPASDQIAAKLQIPAGAEVYLLRRLRIAGSEPMGLQTVHVPCELAPGLFQVNFETASLYETLEKRYRLAPEYAAQTHFAIAANEEEAPLLNVPEGSPVLGGERLTFLRDGRPLELTNSVMRGDRYQIQLKLVREPVRQARPE